MTPEFYESVIIKFLFEKPEVRDVVFPYLDPKIFSDFSHVSIIKSFIQFFADFKKYPTVSDLKLSLKDKDSFDTLEKISKMTLENEYSNEALLSQLELFFQQKMLFNQAFRVVEGCKEDDISSLSDIPDKFREALAFSFHTDVGTDLFDDVDKFYDWLHSPSRTISTGIKTLDSFVEGGFAKETLTVFMGESNIGKSITLAGLAVNCLQQKNNVLYLTLEMSDFKTMRRMYANLFDINISDMMMVPKQVLISKKDEMENSLGKKMILQKYPTGTMTANHIRNILKELSTKKNFIPDIIFIDYLGIMKPVNSKREGNMYQDIKAICEEVRAVAVEYELPIVSVAQISKGGYSNAEIELKDVAESMGLVHTCDVIVGITQSDEMRAAGKFTFAVLKNRDGINKHKIYVDIDYPHMRISEPVEDLGDSVENPISQSIAKTVDKFRNSTPIGIIDDASVESLKTKNNSTGDKDSTDSYVDFD